MSFGSLESSSGLRRQRRREEMSDRPKQEVDTYSEELQERAQSLIKWAGYTIDTKARPYKAFGRERFYIQKCFGKEGEDAVVKIDVPNQTPGRGLEREGAAMGMLGRAIEAARQKGADIGLSVPEKIMDFEHEGLRGMSMSYVPDNKREKYALPVPHRLELIEKLVTDFQKLEVPQELLHQEGEPGKEKVPVFTPEVHMQRMKERVAYLRDEGQLTPEECDTVEKIFEKKKALLESFPLKFSHGDLHAENIAYEKSADGKEKMTLLDLEDLKIDNEFFDWAMLSTLAAVSRESPRYARELSEVTEQAEYTWLDVSGADLDRMVEREVVARGARGEDAVVAFNLMRIQYSLGRVAATMGREEDPVRRALCEIYTKILKQDIKEIQTIPSIRKALLPLNA